MGRACADGVVLRQELLLNQAAVGMRVKALMYDDNERARPATQTR